MNPTKTVLIVEDDAAVRSVLRRALQRLDYGVLEAENGEAGLAALESSAVDAVILDLLMPSKEGIETLIEIRREGRRLPVVVISGGGHLPPDHYLHMARHAGASAVFTKPVDLVALEGTLRELISSSGEAAAPGPARPAGAP